MNSNLPAVVSFRIKVRRGLRLVESVPQTGVQLDQLVHAFQFVS